MNDREQSRFDELVSRYLDETLTGADASELATLLADSPLSSRFLEMTRLNSEIAGLLAAPVPDAAMVELVRADIEKHIAGLQPAIFVTQPSPHPSRVRLRVSGWPLAWAAVFVMVAGLAALFIVKRARSAHAAVVATVQGEARLLGPKGERVLTAGQAWQHGEKLRTVGPSSAATLKLRDGSQLDFGGNTIALNESDNARNRVVLEHGEIKAVVEKQAAAHSFVFATPEAEAVVVGTKLRLVTGAHHTRLEVTEGEVRFRRRHDGSEVAVKAGYFATVAPNVPLVAKPIHATPHHVQ